MANKKQIVALQKRRVDRESKELHSMTELASTLSKLTLDEPQLDLPRGAERNLPRQPQVDAPVRRTLDTGSNVASE